MGRIGRRGKRSEVRAVRSQEDVLTILWSSSAFLAPYLLGQPAQYTVAVEVDRQVHMDLNWPLAAALNMVLIAILAITAYVLTTARRRNAQ